jgi:hypothetical protein
VDVKSLVPETGARTTCFKAHKYFISERNVYCRDLTGPNYGTGVFNIIFSTTVRDYISHSYQTHEKVPAFLRAHPDIYVLVSSPLTFMCW